MVQHNFEQVARNLLGSFNSMRPYLYPTPIDALVEWRNGIYIGHIQIIVPDYSLQIVSLSKSTYQLQDGLVDAIKKLDPNRLNLIADEELDLRVRNHVLRKIEDKLTILTPEQTKYMLAHPFFYHEVDSSINN